MYIDITARKRAEKTLQEQMLRRWYAATLGREGRSIELKREVNALLLEIGKPPRYPNAVVKDSSTAYLIMAFNMARFNCWNSLPRVGRPNE